MAERGAEMEELSIELGRLPELKSGFQNYHQMTGVTAQSWP